MSFDGKNVSLQVFYPDLNRPISSKMTATVGAGIEFNDIKNFQTAGSVVNVDVDVSFNRISLKIDEWGGGFASTSGFNGYKFSDQSNNIAPITGVTIVKSTNSLDIGNKGVFFAENAIFIDVEGLRYDEGKTIDLIVSFGSERDAGRVVPQDVQSVARLYAASFGRMPDQGGLNYWIDKFESGTGVTEIAQNFYLSPEFNKQFGTPKSLTDAAFVNILYSNILSRPGESAGVDFWISKLASGYARSNLPIDFATSAENVALTGYAAEMAKNLSGADWLII